MAAQNIQSDRQFDMHARESNNFRIFYESTNTEAEVSD